MKSNIITTGGNGFLGSILSEHLRNKYGLVDIQDSKPERVDISRPFILPDVLNCEAIIHTAGKAHSVPRTTLEEQLFFDVNLQGTKNLCSAVEKLRYLPKAIIFISSVAVYGIEEGENIAEHHPRLGLTPYAKSKIQAEDFLCEWCKANAITLGILRLPLIAGPNPPGNLGAMINAITTGKYLSIGNATARKSLVWGEDIANLVPKLIDVGGTYNLTDGHHPSFRELETAISKALNKSKPLRIPMFLANWLGILGNLLGDRAPINSAKMAKITSTLTFDDSKARRDLGWTPTRVITKISEIV